MAHGHNSDEKVVYVGDSRVAKRNNQNLHPRDYSAYPGKSEAFIPNFLLKEWMVGAVFVVGFMVLTISHPSPLGYPADPLTPGFIPMPDWYFLFMYQLLKYPYMSGDFRVLGTVVVPGIAFGALLLAPFLDTSKERRFYRRPFASALMFLSLISIIYLTIVSWSHYQHELKDKGIIPEHIKREEEMHAGKAQQGGAAKPAAKTPAIVAEDDPAYAIYQKASCVACHAKDLKKSPAAPELRGIGDRMSKDDILKVIRDGRGNMPPQGSSMAAADIEKLADWLSRQKAQK